MTIRPELLQTKKIMPIKVLVVDDSLFMRTLVSEMLNSAPDIKVIETAKNGTEALKKIAKTKPDCITLDLAMPGWDGLTTLKHIMSRYPTPVVILSAHSKKDAEITIKCLNAGAIGFVLKPSGELSLDIETVKERLIQEVKAAASVSIAKIKLLTAERPRRSRRELIGIDNIVVIGASTGGPQTLEAILPPIPPDFAAPILVVQHAPSRFVTQSLAEHLNKISEVVVKDAEYNDIIQTGYVYLAPGGFRLTVTELAGPYESGASNHERRSINLTEDEPRALSPSIDITMKSVAKTYNGNVIGIILTGMGHDGREGMKAIKESGGKTIAQDESSLIFGMPKVVIDAGFADKVLPAAEIAGAIVDIVEKG